MEKEERSYYLVSYCGTRETVVQTEQEYKQLSEEVKNYNNKAKNKYLLGNLSRETRSDGIHVVGHKYRKLNFHKKLDPKSKRGAASTIEEIQEFTTQYSKQQLASMFTTKETGTPAGYIPDINVAYKNNRKTAGKKKEDQLDRRISYLQVMYSNDRDNFSIEYIIKKRLRYHVYSRDFGALKDLCNALCYNRESLEELEKVRIAIDKCQNQNYSLDALYEAASNLIRKYIAQINKAEGTIIYGEDGKPVNSKRRVYDIAEFFKFCGAMNQKHMPFFYNEGPTEEKKKELRKEEEERKVRELIKTGKYYYEQMSLF